jgi:hypothetical protein
MGVLARYWNDNLSRGSEVYHDESLIRISVTDAYCNQCVRTMKLLISFLP